jgi:hypothetical protein
MIDRVRQKTFDFKNDEFKTIVAVLMEGYQSINGEQAENPLTKSNLIPFPLRESQTNNLKSRNKREITYASLERLGLPPKLYEFILGHHEFKHWKTPQILENYDQICEEAHETQKKEAERTPLASYIIPSGRFLPMVLMASKAGYNSAFFTPEIQYSSKSPGQGHYWVSLSTEHSAEGGLDDYTSQIHEAGSFQKSSLWIVPTNCLGPALIQQLPKY